MTNKAKSHNSANQLRKTATSLKLEAAPSYETSVIIHYTPRCHVSENGKPHCDGRGEPRCDTASFTERVGLAVTLWEVFLSNLGRDVGYPERGFSFFCSVPLGMC
jgi:hypothetical protein